jgi:hypothetical protein
VRNGILLVLSSVFNNEKGGCFGLVLIVQQKDLAYFRRRNGALFRKKPIEHELYLLLMVGYAFTPTKGFYSCKMALLPIPQEALFKIYAIGALFVFNGLLIRQILIQLSMFRTK